MVAQVKVTHLNSVQLKIFIIVYLILSLKNLTNHINIHIKKFITILIIIIYCAGWYMPFCCNIYIKSPLLKFYKNTSRALNKSMTTDTVIDFFK